MDGAEAGGSECVFVNGSHNKVQTTVSEPCHHGEQGSFLSVAGRSATPHATCRGAARAGLGPQCLSPVGPRHLSTGGRSTPRWWGAQVLVLSHCHHLPLILSNWAPWALRGALEAGCGQGKGREQTRIGAGEGWLQTCPKHVRGVSEQDGLSGVRAPAPRPATSGFGPPHWENQ